MKKYFALKLVESRICIVIFDEFSSNEALTRLKVDEGLTEKRLTSKNSEDDGSISVYFDDDIGDKNFVLIYGSEVDKIDL